MSQIIKKAKHLYEKNYKNRGLNHQRRYPNEELCIFFGRNFFSIKKKQRKKIKILETGCGTCGNLKMISREGFSTFGIDFSNEAIKLSRKLFKKEKLNGSFKVGDFTSMEYKSFFFDCIIDVFSSCTLDKYSGQEYIKEVSRVLKKRGKFFSYFPSKKSDMFNCKTRKLFDSDTLMSVKQKTAYTTDHAIRFMTLSQYSKLLTANGFKLNYKEEVMRTYFSGKEKFYFLVIDAIKT